MKKFSIWLEEQLNELAAPGQQPATGTAPATTSATATTQKNDPSSPAYKLLLAKNIGKVVTGNQKDTLANQLVKAIGATGEGKTL